MTRAQRVQVIAKILLKRYQPIMDKTEAIHVAYLIDEALTQPPTKVEEAKSNE